MICLLNFVRMQKFNLKLIDLFSLLNKHRYIHFFIIGASGVLLNLIFVWFFTEFVFGVENYFYGYLIGLTVNLIYLFILNSIITFKTKKNHVRRFILFIIYSLLISYIQANIIKLIVPMFGEKFYLIIIASVIFIFSTVSFFVMKLKLFKE